MCPPNDPNKRVIGVAVSVIPLISLFHLRAFLFVRGTFSKIKYPLIDIRSQTRNYFFRERCTRRLSPLFPLRFRHLVRKRRSTLQKIKTALKLSIEHKSVFRFNNL